MSTGGRAAGNSGQHTVSAIPDGCDTTGLASRERLDRPAASTTTGSDGDPQTPAVSAEAPADTRRPTTRLRPNPRMQLDVAGRVDPSMPMRPAVGEAGPPATSSEWLITRVFKDFLAFVKAKR